LGPSQKFARPEKNMASNTKGDSFLPAVYKDDETYKEVLGDVKKIISDNFKQIGKVTDIFEDFKFLLTEEFKIQDMLERNELTERKQYKKLLDKYSTYWQRINDEIPF